MKSCPADRELLIHTHLFHLKMKVMLMTIKLKIVLKLLKIKHLWNKIQTHLKCTTKSAANPRIFLADIFTRQVKNPSVEVQPQLCEVYFLVQTEAGNGRLRIKHQKRTEAANKLLRKQDWNVITCWKN